MGSDGLDGIGWIGWIGLDRIVDRIGKTGMVYSITGLRR
jgi:hypothetical protein